MTLGEEAGGFGIGIGISIGIGIGISVATSELKCSTILCLTVLFADPAVFGVFGVALFKRAGGKAGWCLLKRVEYELGI